MFINDYNIAGAVADATGVNGVGRESKGRSGERVGPLLPE